MTGACRGCLAHRCEDVCRFGAITFDDNHVAHIDKSKCVECGACAKVCPYSAIRNYKRPCENACKVEAISMGDEKQACIDNSKCISCGACVYQCPFGAITDKSFILDVIDILKERSGQELQGLCGGGSLHFQPVHLCKAWTGHYRPEGAWLPHGDRSGARSRYGRPGRIQGACRKRIPDQLLLSCVCGLSSKRTIPSLVANISHNLSPMATIAKYIKEHEAPCKIVFIGPCTAKKMEVQKERIKPYVDAAMTFEELQALFDSTRPGHHHPSGRIFGQRLLFRKNLRPVRRTCPMLWQKA